MNIKTHLKQRHLNTDLHPTIIDPHTNAELNCILKSRHPGHKIVICRIGGHGGTELRDSFCCPICYLYITKNCPTIKEIHWSTSEQDFNFMKI